MRIADEFFLIVHDDSRGRPRLNPTATGLGLAAGLLGELVLTGRVTVSDGRLSVLDRRPPADALAGTVLAQLVGESRHRLLRTWLVFLARTAADAVGERLSRAGVVRRQERRGVLRASVSYVAVDRNALAWPGARLLALLERPDPPTVPDALLCGLVAATGLTRVVLWDADPRARRRFGMLRPALPRALRELVGHTEAAVGAAVLRG
ncbi:GPP34 family phosphoprotein [Micromonospora sp. WMMD882]|uniref:GOLPH3/VPS74 family protein n=1 Tax=Micromonospora sp. WMMD882 TaxID=3015151 RepID=UPI00248B319B|nr:GPP34 family phosphoprotein [Micromonospora sp. WMMD882]WBB82344.1 GPP34 family phosphoprotein [Micromonospora sp. WMMD882]